MDYKEITYTQEEMYEAGMVREAASAYNIPKQQGEFTIEDYYRLPDDARVELIDGVLYDMAVPTWIHQIIANQIGNFINNYIKKKKGECIVLVTPMDVQLDSDERTMVQPDVLILCDRDKIRKRSLYGAPGFVVEILSPSTRKKDITIKLRKYKNAGVREYWIVDPDKKVIYVYEFAECDFSVIYTFDDKISVGIFGGECEVNFEEIYEYVKFLYNEE